MVSALDLPPAPIFNIDPTSGKDIRAMLTAVVKALKEGVSAGTVTEWTPTDEERRRGSEFTARVHLVGRHRSHFGEDIDERWPVAIPEDAPGSSSLTIDPHRVGPSTRMRRRA